MLDRQSLSDRRTSNVYDELRQHLRAGEPWLDPMAWHLIDAMERGDREQEAEIVRLRGSADKALAAVQAEAKRLRAENERLREARDETLQMLGMTQCPYILREETCDSGCCSEPACITDEPLEGWVVAAIERLADEDESSGASDEDQGAESCGRLLVGQGSDTYDPLCVLPAGHDGLCKPEEGIDA